VTVVGAKISLPFLTYDRTEFLEGGSTPRLESYLEAADSILSAATIAEAEIPFEIPPPLAPRETEKPKKGKGPHFTPPGPPPHKPPPHQALH
jgi:hypothetical protein